MSGKKQFIAYSLPGTTEYLLGTVDTMIPLANTANLTEFDFVLAPFEKANNEGYLIKFSSLSSSCKFSCCPENHTSLESTSRQSYSEGFDRILQQIESGQLNKVVLARRIFIEKDFEDVYDLFIALKNKYPQAFTYLVHTHATGTWMGASPESVLEENGQGLITKAIAGTKAIDSKSPWSDKEVQEHKYIETFYQKVLTENEIEFSIAPTHTIPAGNVCHICSEVTMGTTTELIKLAELIHPSPALCGYPKALSLSTILEVEEHDRQFYCGYLGPIKQVKWYANIRCMQVFSNCCILYVGGGITGDSKLEAEWIETEMKSKTLLSVIDDLSVLQ